MDGSLQAVLSMGFSRQSYWSGLPVPSPVPIICMLLVFIVNSQIGVYLSMVRDSGEGADGEVCSVHSRS